MPRRVSLPGAAELFRATPSGPGIASEGSPSAAASNHQPDPRPVEPAAQAAEDESRERPRSNGRSPAARGSGRIRHDEKITVYVSNDELLELERARLTLRADHGMAVDRGRIVREALALVIADLAERGSESDLVRRLAQP